MIHECEEYIGKYLHIQLLTKAILSILFKRFFIFLFSFISFILSSSPIHTHICTLFFTLLLLFIHSFTHYSLFIFLFIILFLLLILLLTPPPPPGGVPPPVRCTPSVSSVPPHARHPSPRVGGEGERGREKERWWGKERGNERGNEGRRRGGKKEKKKGRESVCLCMSV